MLNYLHKYGCLQGMVLITVLISPKLEAMLGSAIGSLSVRAYILVGYAIFEGAQILGSNQVQGPWGSATRTLYARFFAADTLACWGSICWHWVATDGHFLLSLTSLGLLELMGHAVNFALLSLIGASSVRWFYLEFSSPPMRASDRINLAPLYAALVLPVLAAVRMWVAVFELFSARSAAWALVLLIVLNFCCAICRGFAAIEKQRESRLPAQAGGIE